MTQTHASPVWPAAVFVADTVLVVASQVPVTVLTARFPRRSVPAVAAVSVVCTLGEIRYAGSATALVTVLAPARVLGRALARGSRSGRIRTTP